VKRAALLLVVAAYGAAPAASSAKLELASTEARIGDAIGARIVVSLDPGVRLGADPVTAEWGDAQVLSGAWQPETPGAPSGTRVWSGTIAIYKVGAVTVPAVALPVVEGERAATIATAPVSLTIKGTVGPGKPGEGDLDLANLKPPASIPPDYGPLEKGLAALAALLAATGVAWWLIRRYASKFAAVAVPEDPFRKLSPHVWAYEELRKLLDRRLAEEGKIGAFYDELTRIVKMYLEGRYRIDLLERTTTEVPAALQQAGAPAEPARLARTLLEAGDLVKFARLRSGPVECRASVDEAYRLVDLTKPEEAPAVAPADAPAAAETAR
jgi:hypothetical protein